PLGAHDRVVRGAPNGTVLTRHVAPANAFEHRTQSLDRSTRTGVAFVRLEGAAMHLPDVERVGQQEVLRLRVAPRALSRAGQPGGADLHRIGVIGSLRR